jgi:DNA replication regulator DPB11
VSANGGIFVDTLEALSTSLSEQQCSPIVIISHDHPRTEMPSINGIEPTPDVVTEMWVEKCISAGTRVSPDEYPFSRPVQQFPIPGFERLVINSTGFEVIQLLHTSKIVNLLGGKYDETLKPDISVLVCASKSFNRNKSLHARLWRMPVVSSDWLWSCMERGQLQSFDAYKVLPNKWELEEMAKHKERDVGNSSKKEADPRQTERSGKKEYAPYEEHSDSAKEGVHLQGRQIEAAQPRGTSRDLIDGDRRLHNSATIEPMPDADADADEGLPLREISPNSPPKVREDSPKSGKKSLFRTLDGQDSVPGSENSASGPPSAPQPTSTGKTDYIPPQADTINGAIQELLGLKSRSKSNVPSTTNSPIKKTLLGRALSNRSNSSSGPLTTRPSRASSVDSVNTDGVGSVIALDGSGPGRPPNSVRTQSTGFTGRASAREAVHAEPSVELGDRGLYEDEFTGEEPAPQMTQLGYGEHEDAIRLREQLAEKRRKRSKQGQETTETIAKERKIRDDDMLLEGGWGGGRRTRQKDRAPKGMEDF